VRAVVAGVCGLLCALACASVAAQDHAVGLRLGLNYSILGPPADEPGDTTFMAGTAFTGVGLAVGLTYEWRALHPVSLETGLMYSHATANGFQIAGEQQREAEFQADTVRVPIWLKYELDFGPVRGVLGMGPELVLGLSSAAEVREVNVPAQDAAFLETTSVTTMHLTGIVGIEVEAGAVDPGIALHASLNPLAGSKTTDRFETIENGAPSQLRAEFDYEILVLIGVAYDL
jgi:hypothetical protein